MVNIDGLCMVLKCNEEELLLRIAKQPGSYRGIIPSEIQKVHWGIYELSCLYLRKLIYYAACRVPYGYHWGIYELSYMYIQRNTKFAYGISRISTLATYPTIEKRSLLN